MGNADAWISLKKTGIAFTIFAMSSILSVWMNTPEAMLPLGAVMMGAWNFIKNQWLVK